MENQETLKVASIGKDGDDILFILFYTITDFEQHVKPAIEYCMRTGFENTDAQLTDSIEYRYILPRVQV